MKRFLIIFLVLVPVIYLSQAKIGMGHSYTITPVAATNPSVGVLYGDSVHIYSYVKNSGNVAYTGSVQVQAKRDTTSGITCDSLITNISLQPYDSILTHLVFTPTPGLYAFKVGGNGNTIVVWPYISNSSVLMGDNFKSVIWISGAAGIREHEISPFNLYPNPVTQYLNINPLQQGNYKNITVYDMFARKVKEQRFETQIDLSDLAPGNYWLMIRSDNKHYYVRFVKEDSISK